MRDEYNQTNKPIVCKVCQSSFGVDALSASDYEVLQNRHYYESFEDESKNLLRVQNLYQRHPEVEGIVEANFQKRLFENIEPEYEAELLSQVEEDDKEVLEYLRHTHFSLVPRLQFVTEQLANWEQPVHPVMCFVCRVGELKIDANTWIDPNYIYD